MTFKAGDIVRTKIGGPNLKVDLVSSGKDGMVHCHWLDKNSDLQTGQFNPESLEAVGPIGGREGVEFIDL